MPAHIDNPQKIGIGALTSFGFERLVTDLETVDPGWFYTWTPGLPSYEIEDWTTGKGVTIGGDASDRSVLLDSSPDAWLVQKADVVSGLTYRLSLVADAAAPASGGIAVSFRSSTGASISGGDWLPLNHMSGAAALTGLRAPSNAASVEIIAWGAAGILEIDDIALTADLGNRLQNGSLQSVSNGKIDSWLSGSDVRIGGSSTDRDASLGASPDAWIFQDVAVSAGAIYDLSFSVGAVNTPDGGIMVEFRDAAGARLSSEWSPITGEGDAGVIKDIEAPEGATTARIIAWNGSGTLKIDDLAFSERSQTLIGNGSFQSVPMIDADDLTGDYVPMIWGAADVTGKNLKSLGDARVILGFNEPDHPDQSDMSVRQALDLWPQLMETGARLGSPAATTPQTLGSDSWLGRFMDGAEDRDLRVDFVATHYYSKNQSVDAFENFLTRTHEAYDRPIWVTEWGLVDWSNRGRFTHEETSAFFREAVEMMDKLDFVERHAWFGLYDGMDNLDINTELFDNDGTLTAVGESFAEFTRPIDDPDDAPVEVPVDAPDVIAEYGITHAGADGVTVAFDHAFANPVVIATVTTMNDPRPVSVRVSEIEGNTFTLFLDNPNHLATTNAQEQVSWIVAEAGQWNLGDGMEMQVGAVTTNRLSSAGSTDVAFHADFDGKPVVLTTQQTAYGSDMLWDRVSDVQSDGFDLWLAEEENLNAGKHKQESIGWLGISRTDGVTADPSDAFEFRTSDAGLKINHRQTSVDFGADTDSVVFAGISSHDGTDPAGLRIGTRDGIPSTAFIQEDTSRDAETDHFHELIDWLVLDGNGVIHGQDMSEFV